MASKPASVDVHVGARLKFLRQERGKSQTAIADSIGVSFQQIQKYERGTNRVSASRLQQIADILGVPAAYFFDGLQSSGTNKTLKLDPLNDLFSSHDSLILIKAFNRVHDRALRRRILDLVLAIAKDES